MTAPTDINSTDVTPETTSDDGVSTTSNKVALLKPARKTPVWSPDANHGRYGFDDYPGLETMVHRHSSLKAGDACPECAEYNQTGRLYEGRAGVFIRLVGNPVVTGTRHKAISLRCTLCQAAYEAEVPEAVLNEEKFHESVPTAIAINHYYLGLPFKRLETAQANQGVPLPDATQYDCMVKLEKIVSPVHHCLEKLSSDSQLISYDDTPAHVLQEGNASGGKKLFMTAILSECGPHTVYLFNTSRYPAGRTVGALLQQRESETELTTMRDASSQNNLTDVDETLLVRLVIAFCLVHGRRKFHQLLDTFPAECGFVVDSIAQVYKYESHCKKEKLTPEERLLYHQQHSAPVMARLKTWLEHQWQFERVEQNGPLGQAVRYMLKHWRALTEFLRVPGCPIDNSHCERAIKIFIRYRKASMFYRTLRGAAIGDALMSIIHTAVRNKINAYDYLNALQIHAQAVAESPECWLPWNYQETLQLQWAQAA